MPKTTVQGQNALPVYTEPRDDDAPLSAPEAAPVVPSAGDIVPDTLSPPEIKAPSGEPALESPVAQPPVISAAPSTDSAKPSKSPSEMRERSLYLMEVDPDGTLLRTKVTRNLPLSNSPLVDVLNVLLQGPIAAEKNRGLISLIPGGTRIITANIQGSTAYLNFNENFLFNEFGVEGYAGQLRQVVWTATEFSNIKDVQILIEGRRIDYLGESIWIGSPIGRESR